MENNYCVYGHVRKDNGKCFYIGKGSISRNRAYDNKPRNKYWSNVIEKAGGYDVIIYVNNISSTKALELEKKIIQKVGRKNLTNMTDGGDNPPSHKGKKRSQEFTAKRLKTLQLKKQDPDYVSPNKGKKLGPASEERKSKQSEAQKGKKRSPESMAKRTETRRLKKLLDPNYGNNSTAMKARGHKPPTWKGKKLSPEQIAKRQETRKLKKAQDPNYGKRRNPDQN